MWVERSVTLSPSRAESGTSISEAKPMPAGLGQQPLAGIDQQHCQIGGRGTGDHVAGVLLVPRRVGDDKGAPRRREKTVSDVDRDALLSLVFEPIEQKREIDVAAGRAEAPRLAFEGFELVGQ